MGTHMQAGAVDLDFEVMIDRFAISSGSESRGRRRESEQIVAALVVHDPLNACVDKVGFRDHEAAGFRRQEHRAPLTLAIRVAASLHGRRYPVPLDSYLWAPWVVRASRRKPICGLRAEGV